MSTSRTYYTDVSDCRRYLFRDDVYWNLDHGFVNFVMLNPKPESKRFTHLKNRCIEFAKRWNYGGVSWTNIFPLITDNQTELIGAWPAATVEGATLDKPAILDRNAKEALIAADYAKIVVCCWGAHGDIESLDWWMSKMLRSVKPTLYHLGITKAGDPAHPSRASLDTTPMVWIDRPPY